MMQRRFATPHAVFFEKASTAKVYLRDMTVMPSYPLLLFGGSITINHERGLLFVDDWSVVAAAEAQEIGETQKIPKALVAAAWDAAAVVLNYEETVTHGD